MKKTNTLFLLLLLLSVFPESFAQYSFERTIRTEDSEAFYGAFEDQDGNYICVGAKEINGIDYNLSPFVVKYNSSGDMIETMIYEKIDTAATFQFGIQKNNGNYLFMGTMSDSMSPNKRNFSYMCEADINLQIIKENYYKIPEPYHSHTIENFLITPDQKLIIEGRADSSLYGYDDALMLSVFDMEGNLLHFSMPEYWKDNDSRGDIINKLDGSGFYLIGGILEHSFPRDWVEFDYNLNLLDYGEIEDSLSYMSTPLSIKRLSNDNYFIANASSQYPPGDYQDLEIRILDQGFNIVNDTVLFYDEKMYLPVHNGVDFTDENNIWVSVFERIPTTFTGTEEFDVHIFDNEIRLKGSKTFGGDQRYWLYDLTATSDGGCMIVGMVPDFNGSDKVDAYLIKVMPEDILTGIELPPITKVNNTSVIPNPFDDVLLLRSLSEETTFSLFTMFGQEVLSGKVPINQEISIQTSKLKPGIYFYIYENGDGIIQSGKLIKN